MTSPGRNDPCSCNSGKKFKHCCGAAEAQKAGTMPPEILFKTALMQHKKGELKAAESSYRALLQQVPQHPDTNHNLGALLALGYQQPQASLPYLRAAVNAAPNNLQFWISYLEMLVKTGDYALFWSMLTEARQHGHTAPRFNQFVGKQFVKIATAFSRDKNWAATLKTAQHGLSYDDANGHLWHCVGYAYLQLVRYPEATEALQKANGLVSDAHLLNHLGVAHLNNGDHANARIAFNKAVALNPELAAAWSNAAFNEYEANNIEEADQLSGKALVLDPQSEKANLTRGMVLLRNGELGASKDHLQIAITSASQNPQSLHRPSPNPMIVEDAREALVVARRLLLEAGVPFFLCAGTLLGIIRDGDLLPHDKDMDLGVPAEVDRDKVIAALTAGGEFVLNRPETASAENWHWNYSFTHCANHIVMDIFFYHPDDTHFLCGFNAKPHPINSRPRKFAIGELEWRGLSWPIPSPPEQYLVDVYGEEWKIPDPNFDTALSNRCQTPGSKPTRVGYGYVKLYEALAAGKWKKARGICQQVLAISDEPFMADMLAKISDHLKALPPEGS
jgi:tetratricopeptide (TPR) repeat protein